MNILALDATCNRIKYLDYIELQWNRKWFEPGSFSVQILASEYDPNIAYLYTEDRPETGIVEMVEMTQSQEGNFIQLSGHFAEHFLANDIIKTLFNQTKASADLMVHSMILSNKDTTQSLFAQKYRMGALGSHGESAQFQRTGGTIEQAVRDYLKPFGLSCRMSCTIGQPIFDLIITEGKNRSQTQTTNIPCVFSEGFMNIDNLKAKIDKSNFKNYFYVAGQEKSDGTRDAVTLDLRTDKVNQTAYQQFIDARDLQQQDEQSLTDYQALLMQRAYEKSLDYITIENFEFENAPNSFVYLTDFDLGDICDLVVTKLRRSYASRIIEVNEVISNSKEEYSLVFGDKIPTVFERIKLK